MFIEIADASVLLRSKGVFKPAKCFQHNNQVFAKHGSGFIKLLKYNKSTSLPNVTWEEVNLPFEVTFENSVMVVPETKASLKAVA